MSLDRCIFLSGVCRRIAPSARERAVFRLASTAKQAIPVCIVDAAGRSPVGKQAALSQVGFSGRLLTLTLVMGLALAGLLGCAPEALSDPETAPTASDQGLENASEDREPPTLPQLVVDLDAPLLLDAPDTIAEAEKRGADNAACLVCHMNFKAEPLAHNHASHQVGCVACHGDSFAHRNDENNTTPPETMFPAAKIDPFCQTCHKTHDVPAKQIIAHWHAADVTVPDPDAITCTHCHGQHRLKVRTVVWDKATGKLLPSQH